MKENKQFAVIGLGIFGSSLATTLAARGCDVIAIDNDMSAIERISDQVTKAICMDVSDQEGLDELSLEELDAVVIAMSDHFEQTVLTTLYLKEKGCKKVIVKAKSGQFEKILTKVGADKIICAERDTGIRVATALSRNSVVEQYDIDKEYSMVEIKSLKAWTGKSIKALDVRRKYNMNIVGFKPMGQDRLSFNIDPDYVVHEGDLFLVVLKTDDIEKYDM